ncbi:TlyA family RNA methyltransferase [bacterium]|nr:TlyA family RNA methyltransferase [bacterium]
MQLLAYLLEAVTSDERVARGLLLAGRVLVNDKAQTSAHFELSEGASVRVKGRIEQPVSRGADKLRPVLQASGLEPAGRICLDLGASTGGFTQVLLEAGALRVYSVDVGYGLIVEALRQDPRVILLERTNARLLSSAEIPEAVEVVVGDLSFISWRAVLPAVAPLLAAEAELLLLVKPQFELAALGRQAELVGGLVSSVAAIRDVLLGLYNDWVQQQLQPVAVYPAAVRGASGNQEYFVELQRLPAGVADSADAYAARVEAALRASGPAPGAPEVQA